MPKDTISARVFEIIRRCLRFAHRHHRKAAAIVAGFVVIVCALSVAFQLAYPSNRALPGTWVAGGFVSFKTGSEIKQALEKIDTKTVVLKLGEKKSYTSPKIAGLTFATDKNVAEVLDYPLRRRLIPFSFFLHDKVLVQKKLPAEVVARDKLEVMSSRLEEQGSLDPVEGSVSIKDGVVSQQQPVFGYEYSALTIAKTLTSLNADVPSEIPIPKRPVPPIFNAKAVRETADEAKTLVKPFTMNVNGTAITADTKTVGTWLTFTPNPDTKKIVIGYDTGSIKKYLDGIAAQVYRAPSSTTITLTDNQESNRQAGVDGLYLDTTAATNGIVTALTNKQTSATLALTPVVTVKNYVRTYSPTSAGLQALITDWALAHNASGWAISVTELEGLGRSASYRGGNTSETASIYKVFVSYAIQRRVAAGTLDPNAITATGQSIATCLEIVIVHSDNACGAGLANMIGWDQVTADVHAAGFTNTTIGFGVHISSPNDLNLFMTKLNNGTLLDPTQSAALLSRLKRQIYRSGIPTGNKGITVANKVGYVNGYLNDAGIVYAPSGTYVISAFSYGGSWPNVADLAKTVKEYMPKR